MGDDPGFIQGLGCGSVCFLSGRPWDSGRLSIPGCVAGVGWHLWAYSRAGELSVVCRILRVNLGGKTSGGFDCLVNYKGREIELSSSTSIKRGNFDFVGKIFPAIYSPNTNTLEVLIKPVDFEKFNIPFPDSLKLLP